MLVILRAMVIIKTPTKGHNKNLDDPSLHDLPKIVLTRIVRIL